MKMKSSFTFYQVVEDSLDQKAKNVGKNMSNRPDTFYTEQL